MGGDIAIKKHGLNIKPSIKEAWQHPKSSRAYSRANAVILDLSQLYYGMYGNNYDYERPDETKDYLYTTQQLADKIIKRIENSFKYQKTDIFILVADYDPLVPKEKDRKRKERKANNKKEENAFPPYSKLNCLCDEGIGILDLETKNRDLSIKPEPIHMKRFYKSSRIKNQFLLYLMNYLSLREWMGGLARDKHMIIDTGNPSLGVWCFNSNDTRNIEICINDRATGISGEADPRAGYWIWYYGNKGYDIILRSTDTDWWSIAFNSMVQWAHHDNNQICYMESGMNEIVDMNLFYNAVLQEYKIKDIMTFMMAFILTGNDFVFKKDHANGIGSIKVFNYIIECCDQYMNKMKCNSSIHPHSRYRTTDLTIVHKSQHDMENVLLDITIQFNRSNQIAIDLTVITSLWNLGYWTTDWKHYDDEFNYF